MSKYFTSTVIIITVAVKNKQKIIAEQKLRQAKKYRVKRNANFTIVTQKKTAKVVNFKL